jgi:murein DD-endopeptidase MepM/ murein hydrolase activator NlpD
VDRRRDSTQAQFAAEWRRSTGALADVLNSTDGRWAVASTSLMAVVAGAIAWLAIGTLPPSDTLGASAHPRTLLPYQLFQQLAHASRESYAALGPTGTTGPQEIDATGARHSLDNTLAAERAGDSSNLAPGLETHTITLDKGDTLVAALTDAGAMNEDATAAVAALGRVFDLRSLRAGLTLTLTFQSAEQPVSTNAVTSETIDNFNLGGEGQNDESKGVFVATQGSSAGKLLSFSFSPTVEHDITVTRSADGSFSARDVVKQLVAHVHRAGATIDSSLYLAAMQAGIPIDVVVEMIHMFSYKVDFQRDIKPGDSFEVFYNYYYTPDGHPAKQGDISYAVMRFGAKEIALYRYQPDPNEPADYFDSSGQSAKGMLMKTPVDGARITSGFGMRFHPILGYTRMHKGVDFGVPIGTPVMAAGAGTVAFMGVQSGYGKFVLINHGDGYSTAYGHLSRFAPGLRRGARVRQGQVVAFSGMSGMATGPHLHYEIRRDNVQVNPTTVKIAQGRVLQDTQLRDFQVARLHTDALIVGTPLETRLADAGSELRQAKAK